jgi:preprotein translocase subunit SecB
MTQEIQFPLRLQHAFFTSLEFRRVPEVPASLQVNVSVEVKVHSEKFPDLLQIDLRVKTQDEQPLMFSVELVGIFSLVEEQPRPDHNTLSDFVNQRALHMLWPYAAQIIRQITSQMGVNPLNIPTPYIFDYAPSE